MKFLKEQNKKLVQLGGMLALWGVSSLASAALLVNSTTATGVTDTTATLNANLTNTSGAFPTDVGFAYGLTSTYGTNTTLTTIPPSSTINISRTISGLTCGTTYHFAATWFGVFFGPDTTFTTSACPAPAINQLVDATVQATVDAQTRSVLRGADNTMRNIGQRIQHWAKPVAVGAVHRSVASADSAVVFPGRLDISEGANAKAYDIWVVGSGSSDRLDGAVASERAENRELTLGMDWKAAANARLGLALGYSKIDNELDAQGSQVESSMRALVLYGMWQPDKWKVEGQLGMGWTSLDADRYSASEVATLSASRDANTVFATLGISRAWILQDWTVEPFMYVDYARASLDATDEGTAASALAYDKMTGHTAGINAGVEFSYALMAASGKWTPSLRLETKANDTGSWSQSVSMVQDAAERAVLGVDAVVSHVHRATLGMRYEVASGATAALRLGVGRGSDGFQESRASMEFEMPF